MLNYVLADVIFLYYTVLAVIDKFVGLYGDIYLPVKPADVISE